MSKGRAAMFDLVINPLPEGVCIQYKYEPHVSYGNHFHSAMSKALALVLVSLFVCVFSVSIILLFNVNLKNNFEIQNAVEGKIINCDHSLKNYCIFIMCNIFFKIFWEFCFNPHLLNFIFY